MIHRRRFALVLGSLAWLAGAGAAADPLPAEQVRIERLLKAVEAHTELRFVRNGSDYSAAEAVDFLRRKLGSSYGEKVKTVHDFIEQCATRSSSSGEMYRVKLSDGRLIPAGEFLRLELARIEAAVKH